VREWSLFILCVNLLKELGKYGMLLTWKCYCECVRVKLVSSVCLSAEGTGKKMECCRSGNATANVREWSLFPLCVYHLKELGKRWNAVEVGVLLQMCESEACFLCVFISRMNWVKGGMLQKWESFCECARVELVSSVCLSAEGTGKKVECCRSGNATANV
jgi:hypothetical protein